MPRSNGPSGTNCHHGTPVTERSAKPRRIAASQANEATPSQEAGPRARRNTGRGVPATSADGGAEVQAVHLDRDVRGHLGQPTRTRLPVRAEEDLRGPVRVVRVDAPRQ